MTDVCVSKFRVSFFDLDLNFHMNNGRFFTVMDLGRFDLLMRAGHFVSMFSAGYYPVVLSESMIFKKSLNLWQAYELHTHIDSWDKDFFYMTQKFVRDGKVVASANVRACFKQRGRKGIVPVKEVFEFVGEEHYNKELSQIASRQIEMDNALLPRNKK